MSIMRGMPINKKCADSTILSMYSIWSNMLVKILLQNMGLLALDPILETVIQVPQVV